MPIINIVCISSLRLNGYCVSTWLGCGFDHPPQSNAEVKERVELYLYSPSGPSWPLLVWTLPLPLPFTFYYLAYSDFTETVRKVVIKNMVHTSTAQLLLAMLAMKSNNIAPLHLLVIHALPRASFRPSWLTFCLPICAHMLQLKNQCNTILPSSNKLSGYIQGLVKIRWKQQT